MLRKVTCLPPIATPSALSLAIASGLLIGALWISNRANDQVAAAAGLVKIGIRPSTATRPASLRDRLVVGLQARLEPEIEFVELVTARVRSGQLPQRLVDQTFFWARQHASTRAARTQRPIIYFRPAMVARAKRIGVVL
jgi:hypothetical protein